MEAIKIVVEKHASGYIAYPLPGQLEGAIVGEGDSYEEALADLSSAIEFYLETYGPEVLDQLDPVLEAFLADVKVPVNAKVPN